jgi:hypothetical protein
MNRNFNNTRTSSAIVNEILRKGRIVEQEEEEETQDTEDVKSGDSTKDYTEMISQIFHSRTQIHTFHLQTESYAEHMALNGYYDTVGDLIDGLVESYQGKYEILKGYQNYELKDYSGTENTITYLKDLCEKIESLRDCCKDSYIQNQIDTVCELINSTLYKLRFLK